MPLQSTSSNDVPLTLVTFAPCFGVRSPSPFTLKVEALLRMTDQPYVCRYGTPQDGPRGKLPVLIDNGEVIADSRFIRRHLESKYGVDFNEGLDADARARSIALQRVCEEHLYWAQTYFRWADHATKLRDGYFANLARPIRDLVTMVVRRQVRRDLQGHGLGRMTRSEIIDLATEDLSALSAQLQDKPFMFGDRVSALDATAYGLLANALVPDLPSPMATVAKPLFADYVDRVGTELFGKGTSTKLTLSSAA